MLLDGCAARKNVGSPGRVIVPNDCIKSINVTPETYGEIGPDGNLIIRRATVTRMVGCEKFVVTQSKKGNK